MAADDEIVLGEIRVEQDALKRFISARLPGSMEVEDVYQETLVRVLAKSRDIVIARPIAYAYRIASNIIHDAYRDRHEQAPEGLLEAIPSEEPTLEDAFDAKTQLSILTQEINKLPTIRREILIERRLNNISYADIAREYSISEDSVRQHVRRAVLQLSKALNEAQDQAYRRSSDDALSAIFVGGKNDRR